MVGWSLNPKDDWTFSEAQPRLTVLPDAARCDQESCGPKPVNALGAQIRPDLVDRMLELYCDWRASCAEVQASYERFLDASACDRAVAFAAYMAALDREQLAGEAYAGQIRLIQSRCAVDRGRTRRGTPGRGH